MNTEHENLEPGKRGRKASRGQAEGKQSNPPEPFAYSIDDLVDDGPFGRSFIYEEIRAGRLIARKARGRTIILPSDLKAYLAALPIIKAASAAAASIVCVLAMAVSGIARWVETLTS